MFRVTRAFFPAAIGPIFELLPYSLHLFHMPNGPAVIDLAFALYESVEQEFTVIRLDQKCPASHLKGH
jgi:hypothetical protein